MTKYTGYRADRMTQIHEQNLKSLSTHELLMRIVEDCDQDALNHLVEYRRIILSGDTWLFLPEYIKMLCDTSTRSYYHRAEYRYIGFDEFMNNTYNCLVDRFIELPYIGSSSMKCIAQYRSILRKVGETHHMSELQQEQKIGRVFKETVTNHLYLCMREVIRSSNPFLTRYTWTRNGTTLMTLYRPTTVDVKEITHWLDETFPDIDNKDPSFKEEVQKQLDDRFQRGGYIALDDHGEKDDKQPIEIPIHDEEYTEYPTLEGIIQKIVQRKEQEFDQLRAGIRKLGIRRMKQLVRDILDAVTDGAYNLSDMARKYGLSKATLSRFAGNTWESDDAASPDLWKNSMQVILQNTPMLEMAAEAGIKEALSVLLEKRNNSQ